MQAVRNYLEKTGEKALQVLIQSTHDLQWNLGPFGEQFGNFAFVFVGSSVQMEAAPPLEDEACSPLPNEPSVPVEWGLTMTESAQCLLFQRIKVQFDKTTCTLAPNTRKKYRMSQDELLKVRNIIVLFDQLFSHMQSRLSPEAAQSWMDDMKSGSKRDDDMQALVHLRPAHFAMSMLPSQQEVAKKDLHESELKKVADKEIQKKEVTLAQWNFFRGALARDQQKLDTVKSAPRMLRQKLHAKQVSHRARQAAEGEAACKGYQARGFKCSLSNLCHFHCSLFDLTRRPETS